MREKKAEGMTDKKNEDGISDEIFKKSQIEKQNKQFKTVLIAIAIILTFSLGVFFVVDSIRNFELNGVKYSVVKESDLIFYKTTFPFYDGITGKHVADYNVYLRNDPRKLKDVSFNGNMVLLPNMAVTSTEEFVCDGDGVIAMANFARTFGRLGTNVISDKNATCDALGRYMFVNLQASNETGIEQTGLSCYNLNINNCEILEVTEKFMNEAFSKIRED